MHKSHWLKFGFYLSIAVVMSPIWLRAQEERMLDSLSGIYTNPASVDSSRILALVEIAKFYHRSNPDTAIALASQALRWAGKVNYDKGESAWLQYYWSWTMDQIKSF